MSTTGELPTVDRDRATHRWRDGDRVGALELALVDVEPTMLAVARRFVHDDAADVVQEVLLRVWNHPERFDDSRGTLAGYLVVTTRGTALDHVRQIERRRQRERRGQQHLELHVSPDDVDPDLQRHLANALSNLHADQRALVTIAFFEDVSYRRIAATLGLPEGTVKSRMRRTLTQLRNDIQSAGDVGPA